MKSLKRFFGSLWILGRVRVGYLLIVLIGAIPVLVLTVSSLYKLAAVKNDNTLQPLEELLAGVDEHVGASKTLAEQSASVLTDLAPLATQPYDRARYRMILRHNRPELVKPMVERVEKLSLLRGVAVQASLSLKTDPSGLPPENLANARRNVAELQVAITEAIAQGVESLEDLEAIVKDRLDQFDGHICLNEAQQAFQDKQFDACLQLIEGREWSGALRTEADQLARRAEFRQQGEKWVAEADKLLREASRLRDVSQQSLADAPQRSWTAAIAGIRSFIEVDFPTAPHPEDQDLHEQLCIDQQRLEGTYALYRADKLPTLPEKVKEAHRADVAYPKAQLRPLANKFLDEWLKKGIDKNRDKPDVDPDTKEAVGNNGAIYIGIFELSGDYYKHWKTRQDAKSNPQGYRVILPDNLAVQPGMLTPVKCVERYGNYQKALLRDFRSLAAWRQFGTDCNALQKVMDQYANSGGDTMSVSFRDVINFSQDVSTVWVQHIQPLMGGRHENLP